ncbi:endo alpha-1,4 polygalactosaminidase, partial [Cupriavidus sp. KB_39]|uniref:endo alpha-1,4 polygalactosaminidase n=1 Tax=Cupriavidus sp. KB_39 TaxID=3233036 RepID=UPI003F93F72E
MMENNQGMGRLARLAAAVAVATLAACGGGGDDDGGSVVRVSDAAATTSKSTASASVLPTTRWMPAVTDTWQLQLQGKLNTSYNAVVFDFDLFDTPQATIDTLKSQGKRVVCY